MKNIYYITVSYPHGTGEAFIAPEIEEWANRGYRVHVIPMFPKGVRRDDDHLNYQLTSYPLFSLSYLFSALYYLVTHPRVSISIWGICFSSLDKLHKNIFSVLKAFHISRHISFQDKSYIHAHWGGTSSTLGICLAILKKTDWSFTCHRWDIYENNLLPFKAANAGFVRFISERGRDDAVRLGVPYEKSVVVHMGVKSVFSIARHIVDNGTISIMCAASLIEVKGHEYLIRAIKILRDQNIPCVLYLAGDGELRHKLTQLCTDIGVSDCVRFLGQLDHGSLQKLYADKKVDLFVLPSVDLGGGEHEGIPVSIMEAMNHGIPVVATNTGSINELIPIGWGTTVPAKDPQALACALQRLISDNELYFDISKSEIDLISKEWSISASIDRLEQAVSSSLVAGSTREH